jgi:hypothetical protein
MFARFMDGILGCWHTNYSFPVTVRSRQRRTPAASLTGTYVVCLDCGKELPYDWQNMRVLYTAESSRPRVAPAIATRQAA